jgi:hypothetical protein
VFKGTKFIGHTKDKKILKRFLKERKTKYRVEEIEDQLLESEFKNSDEFALRELQLYEHYKKVLCQQDLMDITYVGNDRLIAIIDQMKLVRKELKSVRLDNKEDQIVQGFFELVIDIKEDLQDPETCVFVEDYFNMDSIIDLIISMR